MKHTTYLKISILGTLLTLAALAGITIYVDPLFHYHAPLGSLQYPLYDERYMNDGIVRHFDYDAIITGSSMTENFKTSFLITTSEHSLLKYLFPEVPIKKLTIYYSKPLSIMIPLKL